MRKVNGYISVRALGCYDFEFYVPDNTTNEEINKMVEETVEMSMNFDVEDGYEEYTTIEYRKK